MAYVMLILAAAFWGGNYVVGRVLVSTIAPGVLVEVRWVIASLFLVAVYHRNVITEFPFFRQSFWRTTFLAVMGPVLFPTLLYLGEQSTNAVNASMFLAASPEIVLLSRPCFFANGLRSSISLVSLRAPSGFSWCCRTVTLPTSWRCISEWGTCGLWDPPWPGASIVPFYESGTRECLWVVLRRSQRYWRLCWAFPGHCLM